MEQKFFEKAENVNNSSISTLKSEDFENLNAILFKCSDGWVRVAPKDNKEWVYDDFMSHLEIFCDTPTGILAHKNIKSGTVSVYLYGLNGPFGPNWRYCAVMSDCNPLVDKMIEQRVHFFDKERLED